LNVVALDPEMPAFRHCLPGLALVAGLIAPGSQALAESCPGHPDAIGTSRTLVVDPVEHPRIGAMQYEETLPLKDHEIVLTFDDGPLPKYSNQILDILASQCVKAVFFTIGHMAQEYPGGVQRLRADGQTIGTHSQNHPLRFQHMSIDKVAQEVDDGIASVKAALGDDNKDVAPFFRIPGLSRSPEVDEFLASRGLMTWSADFPADDWRSISSARVVNLAMTRLEARGKGVLLLHDIHARTIAALPVILHELKSRGFHIVQVVPATPDRPKTPTEPSEWRVKPESAARWPATPQFVFAEPAATTVPDVGDLGVTSQSDGVTAIIGSLSRNSAKTKIPLPPESIWPRLAASPQITLTALLPVPAEQLFQIGYDPAEGTTRRSSRPDAAQPHHADVEPSTANDASVDREALNVSPGEGRAAP
jgi:peptidoglycan/xylan/chitin deacetylase (PgdA/CDA1 family)